MNKAISTRLTFAVAILSLLIFIILWQVIAQQGLLVKNFPGSFKTIGSLIWWVSDPFFDNGPNDLGIGTNLLISLRRVLIAINTLLKLISKLVPIPKSFGPLSKNGSDTHQINDPIVLKEPGKFLTNKPC